jgi:glycolate oxidase FAD binding subunit
MSETRVQLQPVWAELTAIVGTEHIRPATTDDVVNGVQPAGVVAPGTAQEIAQLLHYCSSAGLAVVPRGGGTKLSLGNLPQRVDFLVSTERLNQVIEHAFDDMTVAVEAGCTIEKLQGVVGEHGQRLAVDPLQPDKATVGGLLATAESGTLRIRYGAVRDLVLGVDLALPDGTVIKAGGKVVKNVAGYDLTKLVIGSLGTLGVITRAVFRLHPLPVATMTYSTTVLTTADLAQLVLAILDSNLVYTGLQITGDTADHIAVDVRFEGIPDSLEDQHNKLQTVAGSREFIASSGDVWAARQKLFLRADASVVCKCSVRPTQLGTLWELIFREAHTAGCSATVVAQGTGIAEVRFDGGREQAQVSVVHALRGQLDRLEGTLTVQQCPVAIKRQTDIWGPVNALPLMQRIKEKFDPARILNPGRFVGGI